MFVNFLYHDHRITNLVLRLLPQIIHVLETGKQLVKMSNSTVLRFRLLLPLLGLGHPNTVQSRFNLYRLISKSTKHSFIV